MIKRNLFFQGIAQFGGRLFSYVFFLYSARALGLTEFGIFSYVLAIGYMVSIFMDFGIDPLFVKWVARKEVAIYEKVLQTRLLTVGIGLGSMVTISLFLDKRLHTPMILVALGFACLSLINISASFFRGIERMEWEAFFSVTQKGLLLGMGVFVLRYWNKADSAALVYFLSHMIACIGIVWVLNRLANISFHGFLNFEWEKISIILKQGFPLALVGFFGMVYYRVDTLMLALFWNMEEVGRYNGAYKLMEGLFLIPGVILAATFPRLARQTKEDVDGFKKMFMLIGSVLLGLSLMVSVVSHHLAPLFFETILGAAYLESVPIFRILLFAVIAVYLGYLATQSLIALDQQKLYMYIALVGMLLNVLLNLMWIPRFGGQGAAWATVLTESAVTACCFVGSLWTVRSYPVRGRSA